MTNYPIVKNLTGLVQFIVPSKVHENLRQISIKYLLRFLAKYDIISLGQSSLKLNTEMVKMTNFKRILVSVKNYDNYAEVTEIVAAQVTHHKLCIRNTIKHNLPFVSLQQTLPPYTKIRIRLDKLGLSYYKESGEYDFYFEE